jgi:coproporphyrinogen III oxidase
MAATKLPQVSHRFGRSVRHHSRHRNGAWSSGVLNDLQTKLEKYERKAAQFEKVAEEASDGPQRAFYQGLARYCDELATKFRQVIAKRTDASVAAE